MSVRSTVEKALEQGKGDPAPGAELGAALVLRSRKENQAPPRRLLRVRRRAGGIDERWFSSTTPADNGPKTSPNEGLCFVVLEDGGRTEKVTLRDAMAELKGAIIGERIWNKVQGLAHVLQVLRQQGGAPPPRASQGPAREARSGRTESPNRIISPCRTTTTGQTIRTPSSACGPERQRTRWPSACETSPKGDNKITNLSTGLRAWSRGRAGTFPRESFMPPGSLCTYEPQKASDIFAMYQSLTGDAIISEELLWKNTPPDKVGNIDYMIEVLDWEANVDPDFVAQPLHGAEAGQAAEADGGGGIHRRTG